MNTSTFSQDKTVDKYELKILEQVQGFIASMSEETKKLLTKKLEKIVSQPNIDSEEQAIADVIAGRTYTTQEKKDLELVNLINSFSLRSKLLKDTISTTQVAKLLGCSSRQTPLDRVKNQSLLAVKDNGQWKYPLWQFDAEGTDGVFEGLPETIKALQVSNLAKISWLTSPNSVFDDRTPLEMLKEGKLQPVINEAVGVGLAQ